MDIFRIKARNDHNRIVNQREYIGLDKLRMHGKQVYLRYNRYAKAELYIYRHHNVKKWELIIDPETIRIILD